MSLETVDPIDWSHPPPYTEQHHLSSMYCTVQCGLQITRLAELSVPRKCDLRNARPTHWLCGHSGYDTQNSIRKLTVSFSDTFKRLMNVPRYTSSSMAFAMNATDRINVVLRKFAYSLMRKVINSFLQKYCYCHCQQRCISSVSAVR